MSSFFWTSWNSNFRDMCEYLMPRLIAIFNTGYCNFLISRKSPWRRSHRTDNGFAYVVILSTWRDRLTVIWFDVCDSQKQGDHSQPSHAEFNHCPRVSHQFSYLWYRKGWDFRKKNRVTQNSRNTPTLFFIFSCAFWSNSAHFLSFLYLIEKTGIPTQIFGFTKGWNLLNRLFYYFGVF